MNNNLKYNNEMKNLKIDEKTALKLYPTASKEFKTILEENGLDKSDTAALKLKVIIKAVNYLDNGNKIYIPDFLDKTSKFLPYFKKTSSTWMASDIYIYYWCTGCPISFYFKNKKSAETIQKIFRFI